MPRRSPEARAAIAWRLAESGGHPKAPRHMSTAAKRVWRRIVESKPGDYFHEEHLLLLEQLCEVFVAQQANLRRLAEDTSDPGAIKAVKDLSAILATGARQLRLTIQTATRGDKAQVHETEPQATSLLGGEAMAPASGAKRRVN